MSQGATPSPSGGAQDRCALQLVPHKEAVALAELINQTAKCNPRLRIDNVRPSKPIEAIMKHCKTRWQAALGANAHRLVLKAPEDKNNPNKGGFVIQMEWKVAELQAQQ